ncbi:MAG: invasion associated locus B family protein [Alphaproteobacteria bacterium]|nr:invasion associated locus B family protein [Alphaproteobacteria bacterium]
MMPTILKSQTHVLGAALLLTLAGAAGTALAQDAKPAADAGAKPAAEAGAKKPQSAWVKLCEKAPLVNVDKDGKEVKSEKEICLTHHERLDGNTGMVLVSAALRKVEGNDKQSLMVMVPLGMAIPAGVRAAVYTPDQWAKASKNEKVDDKELKPFTLKYSLCHPAGCTAEVEATPEMIDSLKKGGGIMVLAMNAATQPIGFPVPLDGFTAAFDGPPVDNKAYAQARGQLMAQIRERQKAAYEAYQAEQQKKQADGGAAAAAPAPPAAAPKKK